MGVALISEERNKAVFQLDSSELRQTVSHLQSAVRCLPDHPDKLARIWSLTPRPAEAIPLVSPSAAALKKTLGVDVFLTHILQPTPPAVTVASTTSTTSTPLALASRGYGQSLEEAFASQLGRFRNDSESKSQGLQSSVGPTSTASVDLARSLPSSVSTVTVKKEVEGGGAPLAKWSMTDNKVASQNPEYFHSSGACKVRKLSVEMSPWKGCFTTAASEHNNSRISSLVYCPVLEAPSGDWEQKGWLISASTKLFNLWVCGRKTGSQTLELMHSQAAASTVHDIDVDPGASLLLSVGGSPLGRGGRVSLHGLSKDNFFKYQGMIQLPENVYIDPSNQVYGAGSCKMVHIVALQPFGGPLKSALAVGIGEDVLVYELAAASSADVVAAPKASWKAHESAVISSMHRSSFSLDLITGATDGRVKVWDLRSRPGAPARQFGHLKQVTGLSMLDANTLSSCGADGSIHFWDFRSGNRAMSSVVPDGKPVLNMASAGSSPKMVSFTTRHSLYCLEFCGRDGLTTMLSPLRPLPPAGPCTDIRWNTLTKQIYAAGTDGRISVFGSASFS